MRRTLIVLVLLAAGCSSGKTATEPAAAVKATVPTTPTSLAVSCEDHFATGNVAVDVAWMSTTCVDKAGQRHIYAAMTVDCTDGAILLWNDKGWAFVGMKIQPYLPGAEQVPPPEVRAACTP